MHLIVGISGASGAVYGIRALEKLRLHPSIVTHLIVSRSAEKTLHIETGVLLADVKKLASFSYPHEDIASRLASGSFQTGGMLIAPCSINTMAAIAHSLASNLMTRAADVTLKEKRRLVLMVRESPFHLGHLRSMVALAEMGAVIAPPVPAFYHQPRTIDDIVDHSVERALDLLGIPQEGAKRWAGPEREP